MSNYENIKPYADFSHKVAPFGGPEQYVAKVARKNFEAGIQAEKSTELEKGIYLLGLGILIWEGGKHAIKKYNQYRRKKAEVALVEAKKEKEECVRVLEKEIEKKDNTDQTDKQ